MGDPISGAKLMFYATRPRGPTKYLFSIVTREDGSAYVMINVNSVFREWISYFKEKDSGKCYATLIIDVYYNNKLFPGYTILIDPMLKGVKPVNKTIRLRYEAARE